MKALIALNIFLRLGLNYLENWLTGNSSIDNPVTSAVGTLIAPSFSGGSNPLSSSWTLITGLPDYMTKFLDIVLMWEPTVFAGNRVFIWWYFIMPLGLITVIFLIYSAFAK